MNCSRHQQSGIALLMAIIVVVAVTAISVSMVHDEAFLIRKASRLQLLERAGLYAFGLEDFARLVLQIDQEDSSTDDLDEDWATNVPVTNIEAGYLAGYIEDEQSAFNVNSLLDSKNPAESKKRFTRLCDNLNVDTVFIPALMDWIDTDSEVRFPDGAEDGYYPYRVANRLMADVSELLLIKDVNHEMYNKLKPYITALPTTASNLNVNTMSEAVFLALDQNLDADVFLQEREKNAFSTVDDFITRLSIPVVIDGLAVSSEYFRIFGQVVQDDLEYNFQTLIHRDANGTTRIINRSLEPF